MIKLCITSSALAGALLLGASSASAATITVQSAADDETANGNCTLREAINSLNGSGAKDNCAAPNGSNDRIVVGYNYITLSVNKNLQINKPVTIEGSGYNSTTIDAAGKGIQFVIGDASAAKPVVTIQNLTYRNSSARAALAQAGSSLTLRNFRAMDIGDFVIQRGCVAIATGAFGLIEDSALVHCQGHTGAGIWNQGSLSVNRTSIIGGIGEHGVGIFNAGSATITHSTFGRNEAAVEGGVLTNNGGNISFIGVTAAFNKSGTSSGACTSSAKCGIFHNVSGTVRFGKSALANNTFPSTLTGGLCQGTGFTSDGQNLIGESASQATGCPSNGTDLAKADPGFLVGSNNDPVYRGGVGDVYLPGPSSNLLDKVSVNDGYCSSDERGIARRGGGATTCDVGAVERAPALMVVNTTGTAAELQWDANVKGYLETVGYTVTTKDDGAAATADATGKALVFISESVDSATVGTKFRDVGTRVIVDEPSCYTAMRMTGGTNNTDFGDLANQQVFRIQSAQLGNKMGIMSSAAIDYQPFDISVTFGFGVPAASATKTAMISGSSTRAAIFEYYNGNIMAGTPTFYCPGYRMGFFGQPGSFFADNGNFMINLFVVAGSYQ